VQTKAMPTGRRGFCVPATGIERAPTASSTISQETLALPILRMVYTSPQRHTAMKTGLDYPSTYYASTLSDSHEWPRMSDTIDVEVCVVGGGLAGVATALDLAERGRSVALLEQNRIGWGASGRSGGFVSQGFHQGLEALLNRFGASFASELFMLSEMGHALVRERIERYKIDCGPIVAGALSCALSHKPDALEAYRDMAAENFGVSLEYWPKGRVRDVLETSRYGAALFNPLTFSVHPLNLVRGLAHAVETQGGKIFERSPVLHLADSGARRLVRTARGDVRADHVVLACGGYIEGLFRVLSNSTVPVATYVMVTEPLGDTLNSAIGVPYAISDLQFLPNYYRKLADGRLLWGGRASGWEYGPRYLTQLLKHDMQSFFPTLKIARIEVGWSGLMSYLSHEMPALGSLGHGVWYATGFGGLGLAATSMAGRLIGSGIAEKDDRWRLFERFGLPFTGGGSLARVLSQLNIWYHSAAESLGRRPSIS